MVHPPINRESGLVNRDDPLVEDRRAAAQPAREGHPPDVIAGLLLKDLPHLLRVVPVAVLVLGLLDGPDFIMYLKNYSPTGINKGMPPPRRLLQPCRVVVAVCPLLMLRLGVLRVAQRLHLGQLLRRQHVRGRAFES